MNGVISVGCGMMVGAKQSSRHNMWTEITRRKYVREGQRYASNLTDAEWALIEPHMPAAKPLGRPRARPPGFRPTAGPRTGSGWDESSSCWPMPRSACPSAEK